MTYPSNPLSSLQSSAQVANPLKALARFGQSVWLDYIRRSLLTSGELARLIEEDGLCGMTSNPAIFEKAIAGSADYSEALGQFATRGNLDAKFVYEQLAIRDIQDAADALRGVYDRTRRRDGYVSLEVSPYLAHKTGETIEEARRLWKAVGRENVMIKVPGTPEGIPAVRELIGSGVNVNVTLLFALDVYAQVAEAFISGLEDYATRGSDVSRVASVASFFVSRIDTLVDAELSAHLQSAQNPDEGVSLGSLQGKAAIASARLAYQKYREIFSAPRWQALARRGAQTQRLLWASTSTKNPAYRDVLYVEELIGPDTVNTIPPATLDAFRDHGVPRASLEENLEAARRTLENLARAGISLKAVTDQLTAEGVKLFADAFDKLLAAVAAQLKHPAPPAVAGPPAAANQSGR